MTSSLYINDMIYNTYDMLYSNIIYFKNIIIKKQKFSSNESIKDLNITYTWKDYFLLVTFLSPS